MHDQSTIDPYYSTPEWKALHSATLKRDRFKCQYCGDKAIQADHIMPRSRGGADSLDNLVACCKWCNGTAGGKKFTSFHEKQAWLGRQKAKLDPNGKWAPEAGSAKWEALERGVQVWVVYKDRWKARRADPNYVPRKRRKKRT